MNSVVLALVLMLAAFVAGCATTDTGELRPRFITETVRDCEIHHVSMHKKTVTVVHGLMVYSDQGEKYQRKLLQAQKRLFPHAEDDEFVGCDETGEAEVFECPEFRKTRDRWTIANPDPEMKKG